MDELTYQKCLTNLLDCSKRNPLVNFRASSKTATLLAPSNEIVFDSLLSGKKFSIFDLSDFYEKENSGSNKYKLNRDNLKNTLLEKLDSKKIVLIPDGKLNFVKSMKQIIKKATEAINERGVQILYIAFGFLT